MDQKTPNNIYNETLAGNVFQENLIKSIEDDILKLKNDIYVGNDYKSMFKEITNELIEILNESIYIRDIIPLEKKYIPILRSLHESEFLRNGKIKETIKKNYQIDKAVYTGLEIHKNVHDLKTSGIKNRGKIKKFENFLSNNFFNNKTIEITANPSNNELLFSIDGEEYPVHNLGDGIQSLIILLFPIYTADKNDWIFIEEPEMNLHPGLQRVFIETLLNDEYLNSKKLIYFFTTHSNHFLDTSIQSDNISIFQFEKQEDNTFFIKNNIKPDKEVLDILGVNTSSVFLANTSLWIEGPTDRKYISKFLKLYCNHKGLQPLKEDIDFAFFEYGGNLIEHYLFDEKEEFDEEEVREKINTFALSSKTFLLADNDNVKKGTKKDSRRIALNKLSDDNDNFTYQNTVVTEIENLLPKKVVQDFMSELLKSESNILKAKKGRFDRKEYKNIGLGKFYETFFKNKKIPQKDCRAFKAESGTLKNDYKIKLASFVVDSEYTYSDLIEDNKELKTIIENLYNFIRK
ncbi:ATPase AAA [Polaribacter sp. Hel1_85]|nr:ATPase AAA [Polaribacter sp. Hel1_85]